MMTDMIHRDHRRQAADHRMVPVIRSRTLEAEGLKAAALNLGRVAAVAGGRPLGSPREALR